MSVDTSPLRSHPELWEVTESTQGLRRVYIKGQADVYASLPIDNAPDHLGSERYQYLVLAERRACEALVLSTPGNPLRIIFDCHDI